MTHDDVAKRVLAIILDFNREAWVEAGGDSNFWKPLAGEQADQTLFRKLAMPIWEQACKHCGEIQANALAVKQLQKDLAANSPGLAGRIVTGRKNLTRNLRRGEDGK